MSSEKLQPNLRRHNLFWPRWNDLWSDLIEAANLQDHMRASYQTLRLWMGLISIGFPLFLWAIGKFWYGIVLQNSMSAYYFASSRNEGIVRDELMNWAGLKYLLAVLGELDGDTPMRVWFVGILFVLGALLFLYKGHSKLEDLLLNWAGFFTICVALFPTEAPGCDPCRTITVHGISAVAGFVCIAAVAVWCSGQTLNKLTPLGNKQKLYHKIGYAIVQGIAAPFRSKNMPPNELEKANYTICYRITAGLMIVFPVLAVAITKATHNGDRLIFVTELLGFLSFSAYWFVKSLELSANRTEANVMPD